MSPLVYRRLSDEQLGGRLARGEASAFDELYRRYVHRLAAYGANLLGDGAAGDDVAQSTLLRAYGALRDGRVPEQVRPWLYRIAHNVAIDLVRRRREVPAAFLPEGVAPTDGEAGALVAALAALPDRQRRVYVLRELHGLRIDETAAELGLTPPQVEQALFAARNRLAEHLVFGDRLNCASVRRLAAGPLDLSERRALKTHLRSCPACRADLGLRGRALGALPLAPAEWLQWLGGLLSGGGAAPVAAKVGVLVASATVAAGVPLAADRPGSPFRAVARLEQAAVPAANARTQVRKPRHVAAPPAPTTTAAGAQPLMVLSPPVRATTVVKPHHEHKAAEDPPEQKTHAEDPSSGDGSSTAREQGDGGGGDGGDGGGVVVSTTPIPTVTVGIQDGGGSGGSSGAPSGDASTGGSAGSSDTGSSSTDGGGGSSSSTTTTSSSDGGSSSTDGGGSSSTSSSDGGGD